jgi:hypothetical protein
MREKGGLGLDGGYEQVGKRTARVGDTVRLGESAFISAPFSPGMDPHPVRHVGDFSAMHRGA